jgi:cytochrome c
MVRIFELEARAPGPLLSGHEGHVNAVAFSPDGSRLYSGAQDGTIRLWDTATGEMLRVIHRHGWSVNVLHVVPGGEYLLFGAVDGAAWVLDAESGDVLRELGYHDGPVLAADIHPEEGAAAVAGADGHLRVYRVADWTMHHDHSNPYGPIWAVAFTSDGSMIYHGGLDDYVIGLQIDPPPDFEAAVGEFPRRFKPNEEMDLGERQFARKCSVCHTLTPDDANRAGPTLYRLFGREAGTLPGYPYSDALLASDIIWTEETVAELFDHGPDVVTPGTKMPIQRIRDEEELAALVEFLKEATAGSEEEAE